MQEHLFRHFSSPGRNGFLNDFSITFIDKTDPSDPLKREDYRRKTLKTMAPFGLNLKWWSIYLFTIFVVIVMRGMKAFPLNFLVRGGFICYLFIYCLFVCLLFNLITLREQLCALAPWRGEGRGGGGKVCRMRWKAYSMEKPAHWFHMQIAVLVFT